MLVTTGGVNPIPPPSSERAGREDHMTGTDVGMSIGEVARRAGVAPSASRYYEGDGILPAPPRAGGKWRYDASALDWIALIALAREAGCTMAEARQVVAGFAPGTPPAERWRALDRAAGARAGRR
jgi:MerR family redox-sensitive transcriptional activator SoxR